MKPPYRNCSQLLHFRKDRILLFSGVFFFNRRLVTSVRFLGVLGRPGESSSSTETNCRRRQLVVGNRSTVRLGVFLMFFCWFFVGFL